ncbi:MAG TPA: hypothetical protein VGO63_00305 [Candidatus Paceibacterota bacterium]|jgi:hypothetical protein|nr:hypothetical protein [Candidatus Paceibacterota bacterium]
MPKKNLFQDMVKAKNPKKEFKKEILKRETPSYVPQKEAIKLRQTDEKKSNFGLWFIAAICIVFFLFALSFLFTRAEITVNPKIQDVALNENLSAIKDINPDGLAFDLVIISGEDTRQVAAGEEKDLALNSTGVVSIFNSFSSTPQKLAIHTKLEGSNGKTYQTANEVIVPGVIEDGTPGKASAGITAVAPGAEYDSTPLDFKIFGFKGTSKDSKFKVESVGSITGGFKGQAPVIADADKESAFVELKTSLETKLLQKATNQIPEGFILFKDAAFLNIDEQNIELSSAGAITVPVTLKGTLYGFLLGEKELTQKIAKDNITNYNDEPVYIPNLRDLKFSMPAGEFSFNEAQNINFNISGPAKIVWKFEDSAFSTTLLGKPKKEFDQILADYPNVESAQLSLSPFWVRSMPSKLKNIKVIVNYPK